MKTDVADVHSGREGHAKRLDSAIKILVVQGILIVPDPSSGIRHFVPHKPNTIVTRVGLNLAYYRCWPGHDGRLHPRRRTNTRKCEIGWAAADGKLTVGSVVVHIALTWMRLAP